MSVIKGENLSSGFKQDYLNYFCKEVSTGNAEISTTLLTLLSFTKTYYRLRTHSVHPLILCPFVDKRVYKCLNKLSKVKSLDKGHAEREKPWV